MNNITLKMKITSIKINNKTKIFHKKFIRLLLIHQITFIYQIKLDQTRQTHDNPFLIDKIWHNLIITYNHKTK